MKKLITGFSKKILKQFRNAKGAIANAVYRKIIRRHNDGDYFLDYKIPSYAQWVSSELVEDIVGEKINAKDDPRWRESGARTPEEYEMYSWQICGMTCMKMILESIDSDNKIELVKLAIEAEKYQVYKKNSEPDVRINLDGMFHKPFVEFIKKFNLSGYRANSVFENQLAWLLLKNNFIIASVIPVIRENNPDANSKNGHLVLVCGFQMSQGKVSGFYINNPSGFYSNKSQEKYFVPIGIWERCFSGNIIVVYKYYK